MVRSILIAVILQLVVSWTTGSGTLLIGPAKIFVTEWRRAPTRKPLHMW